MIHIEAIGGIKKDRELAEEIVWFCVETLMSRFKTACITVELTKTYEEGAIGFAYMGEDDKDFIIEIDHKLSRIEGVDRFIETVCHEMIHVWQLATKKMKDRFQGGYKQLWKCSDGKYRNYKNTSYNRQPWETEAYQMEADLTELFKEYEKTC